MKQFNYLCFRNFEHRCKETPQRRKLTFAPTGKHNLRERWIHTNTHLREREIHTQTQTHPQRKIKMHKNKPQRKMKTHSDANTPNHTYINNFKHTCTVKHGGKTWVISWANYPPFLSKYSLSHSQTGRNDQSLPFILRALLDLRLLRKLFTVSLLFWLLCNPLVQLCLAEVSLAWLPGSSSRGSPAPANAACSSPRFAAFFSSSWIVFRAQ